MRAVRFPARGVLEIADCPVPQPLADQVLVRVYSAGLNRADLWQLAGGYPAPPGFPQDIPGLEFAGIVETVGSSATRWHVGDRVYGLVGGGAQAEYVAVAESHCSKVPESLSLEEAGGVLETFVAAHDALYVQGQLSDAEFVLIHAVGSGVGTSVLQLAKVRGCTVAGTARGTWKLERAKSFGLDRGIAVSGPADRDALMSAMTDIVGKADVVIDLVGGSYLEADVLAARELARIIMVSTIGGDVCSLNLRDFMNKRLTLKGTVLRGRASAAKTEAIAAFDRDVRPLLENHAVRPIVEQVFRLEDARKAYELLDSDSTFGKVVLTLDA